MKLELKNNKVFFESRGLKKEIHPFWLRERVNGENFVDILNRGCLIQLNYKKTFKLKI